MSKFTSIAIVSVLTIIGLANVANGQLVGNCYISPNAPSYVLPNASVGPYGMCDEGWYCPNASITDPNTYPQICPPTEECMSLRLTNHFCAPQGPYEPVPCEAGWYCPTSSTKIRCPAGHYCILGSIAPVKCGGLSICREGASNEYDMSGILIVVLMDAFVIVFVLFWRRRNSPSAINNAEETIASPNKSWAELGASAQETVYAMFKKARNGGQSLHFEFRELSVAIPKTKNEPEKPLLRGVTGDFRPGHVTAIMGPSGAGKTVFLSTVLNKLNPDWKQEGSLTVNGKLNAGAVRHVVGFVPQDDVLHQELTVEQNLYYSSETRLPSDWTSEEREKLRNSVIQCLGLDHVRHVAIGDESSRGVSGGQRKRCSIGLELAAAPTALFLDEPTTGLDAATALQLCNLLRSLASATDLTVGMVIHQPRVEIWEALDEVLLLAPGGRTVYQGPQNKAQAYFENVLGLTFEKGNPADLILDGIAVNPDAAVAAWDQHLKEADPRTGEFAVSTSEVHAPEKRGASFFRQVALMHHRSITKQVGRPWVLILDVLLGMLASILMGTAAIRDSYVGIVVEKYILLSPKQKIYIVPMLTMFYMLAIASSVAPAGIRTFGSELAQYWREASSGHSRLAYFIGYSTADIYRLTISSFHFALIAYLMWEPIQTFGSFFLLLWLVFLNCDSQSAMLSMWLRPDTAPLMAAVIAVFMGLLNGYPNIPLIGPISYAWWSTEAFVDRNIMPLANIFDHAVLEDQWFYVLGQYGLDIIMLFVLLAVYRIAAFILMIALNREKQR